MAERAPKLITINHDDYHAKHIGKAADGRQFFLTTPFVPAIGGKVGREFIALYLFDAEGELLEAKIDDLGVRQEIDEGQAHAVLKTRLSGLGNITFCNIKVVPFRLERFNTEFGLIPREPEDEEDHWWVILEPGNYMAFYPPWDGNYDT